MVVKASQYSVRGGWPMTFSNLCGLIAVSMMFAWAVPSPQAHAQTERPDEGLMWNRTGLPAVFPLQVKTRPGQNYVIVLSHAATGEDVLAAYIIGGRFFRVLVPPGTFDVRFASGEEWKGEGKWFGGDGQTQFLKMPEPLSFEVKGLGVKAGHLIDLTDSAPGQMAQISVDPVRICQDVDVRSIIWSEAEKRWVYLAEPGEAEQFRRGRSLKIRSRYCWE